MTNTVYIDMRDLNNEMLMNVTYISEDEFNGFIMFICESGDIYYFNKSDIKMVKVVEND